eukprot:IDg3147t1
MASLKYLLLLCALFAAATATSVAPPVCPKCPHGQVCAGSSKVKKCVTPMKEGGRCGVDPFWVCLKGLRCKDHVCVKRRAKCPKCPHGQVCAGTRTVKKCVTPMKRAAAAASIRSGCASKDCAARATCVSSVGLGARSARTDRYVQVPVP